MKSLSPKQRKQAMTKISHIEVVSANHGVEIYDIKDGQLLKVTKETNNFFFVVSFTGKEIKVSKNTKRACNWSKPSIAPTFNI